MRNSIWGCLLDWIIAVKVEKGTELSDEELKGVGERDAQGCLVCSEEIAQLQDDRLLRGLGSGEAEM